jgi:hypothetical protein
MLRCSRYAPVLAYAACAALLAAAPSAAATLPAATLPAATLPAATVPAVTVPAATVPAVTVSAATISAAPAPVLTALAFPAPGAGWVLGQAAAGAQAEIGTPALGGGTWHTTDGGRTWTSG